MLYLCSFTLSGNYIQLLVRSKNNERFVTSSIFLCNVVRKVGVISTTIASYHDHANTNTNSKKLSSDSFLHFHYFLLQ